MRAEAPRPAVEAVRPVSGARSYDEALREVDEAIAAAVRQAEAAPGDWLVQKMQARRLMARGRLTGSYDDYAAAEAALRRSFASAHEGSGPHLTEAQLHFAMHRLPQAARALDAIAGYAVPPDPGERAEIAGMRGDIAFYRGDYTGALALYDEADRTAPGTSHFRRAVYHSKTGRTDLADLHFQRFGQSVARPSRLGLANVELQRGILALDTGRWDEALSRFKKADSIFPGYWLIEEHIAEVTALKGDAETASRLYRDIVAKTGHPEFMDALAELEAKRRAHAVAEALRARAAAEWRRRLRLFPEASYGHAQNHCMAKGDHGCALDLARRNHAARPYGEAKTVLAEALLLNGRLEEARSLIEAALGSGWRTAETHRVAAGIYSATGNQSAAARHLKLGRELNPRL